MTGKELDNSGEKRYFIVESFHGKMHTSIIYDMLPRDMVFKKAFLLSESVTMSLIELTNYFKECMVMNKLDTSVFQPVSEVKKKPSSPTGQLD